MSKRPVHPGLVLEQEWLAKLRVTQYRVAKETFVPPRRINEIVKGLRGITPDTALRFARYFGNKPEYWINLQVSYDMANERERLRDTLTEIMPRDASPRDASLGDASNRESAKRETPTSAPPAQKTAEQAMPDEGKVDLNKSRQPNEKSEDLSWVEESLGVEGSLEQPHQTDFFS